MQMLGIVILVQGIFLDVEGPTMKKEIREDEMDMRGNEEGQNRSSIADINRHQGHLGSDRSKRKEEGKKKKKSQKKGHRA